MPSFDFITSKEFRQSLDDDFKEMRNCIETESWKCAQVIAGSIVESLLIDSLINLPNPLRGSKQLLSLDLGEAITICRGEKILSDRTADLCSVVRSFRNLIHPGRVIRLAEPSPERGSAHIALSLVEIIAEELGRVRIEKVGIRAEQILSKLERDPDSLTILKHLIVEANEAQRERLLLEVLPQAHLRCYSSNPFENEICDRLEAAYKITLANVSVNIKERVAAEYVRVLREEDGSYVTRYSDAFFRANQLENVAAQHLAMVREHLLNSVPPMHTVTSVRRIREIDSFLVPEDAARWLDPIVRTLTNLDDKNKFIQNHVREHLLSPFFAVENDKLQAALKTRLESWKRTFVKNDQKDKLAVLEYIDGQLVFV
jgi:predicted metal-dependent hydrolase